MPKTFGYLCLFGLCCASVLSAQTPVPTGDQFQVNTYTTDLQILPSIGVFEDGRFVVSYQSYGSSGTDADASSILGQRHEADATPEGAEFQVNTDTYAAQRTPDLTTQANGGFTVVWQSEVPSTPRLRVTPKGGSGGTEIRAQRFDSAGAPTGGEFQVDSGLFPYNYDPSIDAAPDSTFVVVWDAYSIGTEYDVFGQQFNADGTAVGSQFEVNSNDTEYQAYSDIGIAADSSFVVAWQSDDSTGTDASGYSIQARRFAADGTPLGPDFQVNTYTTSFQVEASIDAAPNGSFVVAWTSYGSSGTDSADTSIQAQRYDDAGNPVGTEFQVNSITSGYQILPQVAVAPDGRFVVVWSSAPLGLGLGPDEEQATLKRRRSSAKRLLTKGVIPSIPADIFGQFYAEDGTALGGEFQISNLPGDLQVEPSVSFDDGGDFVVSWQALMPSGTDTSGFSIQARRFRTTGDVGDRVWIDDNRNGIQDPLEAGFDGVTVNLYRDGEAMPTDSASTVGGDFFFPQVPAGDWLLEVVAPTGYAFTSQGSGSDGTVDSDVDPTDGRTATFTLDAAQTDRDFDAGLILIEADLEILKEVSPNPFVPGGQVVYSLTATNTGPDAATGVVVNDSLPMEVTWVTDTCGAGPPAGGTLTWNIGTMAAAGSSSCDITVQVGAGVSGGFSNTASISGNEADPNTDNNSSTANSSLATADVDLVKSFAAPPSPALGDMITWTLDVGNTGPDTASDLVITDALPTEVEWLSDTCDAGPPVGGPPGGTLTWMIGDLPASGTASCDIVTRIVAEGTIDNTATASATTFDPNPNNNDGVALVVASPAVLEIPTLSEWAMIALTLLLGLTAMRRLRQSS